MKLISALLLVWSPLALGNYAGEPGTMAGDPKGSEQAGEKAENEAYKKDVAPHSLMIQSSLQSALDQTQGLRKQLELAKKDKPSQESVEHLRIYQKKIVGDLLTAKVHEGELRKSVQKHSDLASSDEYVSATKAYDDLKSLAQSWKGRKFDWKKPDQLRNDLDQFESKLNDALARTRELNSSRLDIG